MSQSRRQDIIDGILGRVHSAPDVFVQQRWSLWMRLYPRPVPTRRDAMIACLQACPVVQKRPVPSAWPAWLALLCWQMGPEPAPDQRMLRLVAAVLSAGLHLGFALLLLWIALVRSSMPMTAGEQQGERMALRFVSAGQEQGQMADAGSGEAAVARSAAASQPAVQRTGASRLTDAAAADATVEVVAVDSAATAALPTVPAGESLPLQTPTPLAAEPDVRPLPPPPVLAAEVSPAAELPVMVQTPPPLRAIAPRPLDFVLEQAPELAVVERTLELASAVPQARSVVLPSAPVVVAPRTLAVPERSIPMAIAAPSVAPVPVGQLAIPAVRDAPALAVAERDIALRQPAPQLTGVQPAAPLKAGSTLEVPSVPEHEVALRQLAPSIPGLKVVPSIAVPDAAGRALAVAEREIHLPARATPLPVDGRLLAEGAEAPAAQPRAEPAGMAAPPVSAGAAAATEDGYRAAAGTAQDWSRPTAGSDDWSAVGPVTGDSARAGMPAGLRAADLPPAQARRGAPGGENDQWTRQRLDAGGTWLRRPPPGHRAGRFDRYWVPNESLLAEWVRQGIRQVEIPLPGGSGTISCVISLLQFGGGCGVTDVNMQEQPARARPAPDIPFKPALQDDNGSRQGLP